MTEKEFLPASYSQLPENGSISYQSPSNIALVKYWGKYGEQLPKNTSISFTLTNCHTKTTLHYTKNERDAFEFEIYLDGQKEDGFKPKISKFFERIETYIPFLKAYSFKIETTNSFPHSSGIASSASGMSALACCLVMLEEEMSAMDFSDEYFNKKASFLARLGSGSASRSIEGPLVVWGAHSKVPNSSLLFGTKFELPVHEVFQNYQDSILLVDKGEKQVSSTVGHNLMHNHPFAEQRFEQANTNLSRLIPVLASGDLTTFIEIVESEALSLHAMMLTSTPYFILMKPNTLEIINRIWAYRKRNQSKVCFTLDAGANVHMLYPFTEKEEIHAFIANELASFCKNGEYIHDMAGQGASVL